MGRPSAAGARAPEGEPQTTTPQHHHQPACVFTPGASSLQSGTEYHLPGTSVLRYVDTLLGNFCQHAPDWHPRSSPQKTSGTHPAWLGLACLVLSAIAARLGPLVRPICHSFPGSPSWTSPSFVVHQGVLFATEHSEQSVLLHNTTLFPAYRCREPFRIAVTFRIALVVVELPVSHSVLVISPPTHRAWSLRPSPSRQLPRHVFQKAKASSHLVAPLRLYTSLLCNATLPT